MTLVNFYIVAITLIPFSHGLKQTVLVRGQLYCIVFPSLKSGHFQEKNIGCPDNPVFGFPAVNATVQLYDADMREFGAFMPGMDAY